MDIAIVTGASAGLGWEFARQIDRRYTLDAIWIVARREKRLKQLSEVMNTPVRIFVHDLTDPDSVERLCNALEDQNAHIRMLVNNAGFGKKGFFEEIDRQKQLSMIDLNIRALTDLTHAALPYMQSGDRILQVASASGFFPMGGSAVYSASKAFALHFSVALSAELEARGITVTAVCPGPVDTEFQAVAFEEPGRRNRSAPTPEQVVSKALHDSDRGRDMSVYGLLMKLGNLLSRFFPRRFLAKRVMGRNR